MDIMIGLIKKKIKNHFEKLKKKPLRNIFDLVFLRFFYLTRLLMLRRKIKIIDEKGDDLSLIDSLQHSYFFVSYRHLTRWTNDWIKKFEKNYDLIIGIPRSGLMVASIIATKLGKPLSTPDKFLKDKAYWISKQNRKKNIKKILVVEDCVFKGRELRKCIKKIKSMDHKLKIDSASLILIKDNKYCNSNLVDIYYKSMNFPFLLEWNLVHAKKIFLNQKVCFDLDGVICDECPVDIDENEDLYKKWINTVNSRIVPTYKIHTIVTNRLEKYRTETERWLKKNNVKYSNLDMWNIEEKKDRKNNFAQRKIAVLQKIKPDLFIESRVDEALEIFNEVHIPVISIDKMVMIS